MGWTHRQLYAATDQQVAEVLVWMSLTNEVLKLKRDESEAQARREAGRG